MNFLFEVERIVFTIFALFAIVAVVDCRPAMVNIVLLRNNFVSRDFRHFLSYFGL